MSAAQLYVSTNVVERLTRGINTPGKVNPSSAKKTPGNANRLSISADDSMAGERPIIDIQSFMGTLGGGGGVGGERGREIFASPINRQKRGSSVGRPSTAPKSRPLQLSEDESRQRAEAFESFIYRNNQTVTRKERAITATMRAIAPTFQPEINRKSVEIAGNRGDFMERVEKDVLRRGDVEQRREELRQRDDGLTFRLVTC